MVPQHEKHMSIPSSHGIYPPVSEWKFTHPMDSCIHWNSYSSNGSLAVPLGQGKPVRPGVNLLLILLRRHPCRR